jgi:hypothetical protein
MVVAGTMPAVRKSAAMDAAAIISCSPAHLLYFVTAERHVFAKIHGASVKK